MNESAKSLWKNRKNLPKMASARAFVAVAICAFLAGASVTGYGGLIFIALSGVMFALVLVGERGFVSLLAVPMAYAVSLLLTGDVYISLSCLLFVPIGIAVAYGIYTGRDLSFTVVITVVATALSVGGLFLAYIAYSYGNVADGFTAFKGQVSSLLDKAFSMYSYVGEDGSAYGLNQSTIVMIKSTFKMMSPALAVMTAEIIAYVAVKGFAVAARFFGLEWTTNGRKWYVTFSRPAALVFIVSYFVSIMSSSFGVAYYSSINLVYILFLPAFAVGAKIIFGRSGVLRRAAVRSTKVIIIASLVIAFYLSPIVFASVIAAFGALSSIRLNKGTNERTGK